MFNIGGSEMILIGLIALIFLPPEKLPGIATQLGRFLGQLSHNFNDVKKQVENGMKAEVKSIQKNLSVTQNEPSDKQPDPTHSPTDINQPPR